MNKKFSDTLEKENLVKENKESLTEWNEGTPNLKGTMTITSEESTVGPSDRIEFPLLRVDVARERGTRVCGLTTENPRSFVRFASGTHDDIS